MCEANTLKNEIDLALYAARVEAEQSDTPIPKIYKRNTAPLKDRGINLVEKVPELRSIKTSLYNSRYKAIGAEKILFDDLKKVQIPKKFNHFLLGDYIGDTRIIVFGTEQGCQLLESLSEFFIDGTFKSCPKPFSQLLIIHGDRQGPSHETNTVPLIFALMPDKKQHSYAIVIEIIKSQVPGWNPQKIHTDYEKSLINALLDEFPASVVKGCYYHMTKALWKKSKVIKIKNKVQRRFVALCTALPLLPANRIEEGWFYIQQQFRLLGPDTKLDIFFKYFQKTWMKNDFPKTWCVFEERHRTNNVAESWNSVLNREVKNVTLLKLLNFLEKATADKDVPTARRREDLVTDTLIMNTQMYLLHDDINVGTFLEMLR